MKPFIYIAGLFRSGTTLVQEMFTEQGKGFIFHEPRFGDGWWQFEAIDRRYLRKWDTDPPKFNNIASTWEWFMEDQGMQIGAKEIRNSGGEIYYNSWGGNMRLLLMDRDPADIYISAYKMFTRGQTDFQWRPKHPPFSPINIYRELMVEVNALNKIWKMVHPLCKTAVNYNSLCEDCGYFQPMYELCESEVTHPDIGGYHAVMARGVYENGRHGTHITEASIRETKTFDNKKVVRDAVRLRELMHGKMAWSSY